jgi:hypothetical protein
MKLQESKTGFYYVGTKRANITKLVSIYKHGYASGKFDQAMDELEKKELLPEVICCDSCYGFAAIKQLSGFLSRNEKLSGVPLIIDTDRKTAAVNYKFIHRRIADDILNLKEWEENTLSSKVRFLQKLKSQNRELEQQKRDAVTTIPGTLFTFLKKSIDTLFSFTANVFLSPLWFLKDRQECKKQIHYD